MAQILALRCPGKICNTGLTAGWVGLEWWRFSATVRSKFSFIIPQFPPKLVMIPRLFLGLVAIASVLLVSCSPYPEHTSRTTRAGTKPTKTRVAQVEQAKQQAQQEEDRRAEEEKQMQTQVEQATPEPPKGHPASPPEPPKLPEPKRFDYPTAKKVPGQEGVVLSPYNNKPVSIRNEDGTLIPSRTLVSDPTYQPSEKKRFFVP